MSDFCTMRADADRAFPSRPRKAAVAVTPTNDINVFVGGAYQTLSIGQAMNLRDQLARAIDIAMNKEAPHDSAT